MNVKVVILRGVPGAGKSTVVRKFYANAVVCSADNYFIGADGRYNYDATKAGEAHSWCFKEFIRNLNQAKNTADQTTIVVDNTNVRLWEYQNYVGLANLLEVPVVVIEVMPTTLKQLKDCCVRNTHNVPQHIIASMAMSFEHDEAAVCYDTMGRKLS